MSQIMTKTLLWHMQTENAEISLYVHIVWSWPLLFIIIHVVYNTDFIWDKDSYVKTGLKSLTSSSSMTKHWKTKHQYIKQDNIPNGHLIRKEHWKKKGYCIYVILNLGWLTLLSEKKLILACSRVKLLSWFWIVLLKFVKYPTKSHTLKLRELIQKLHHQSLWDDHWKIH